MNYCKNCGAALNDGENMCWNCGENVSSDEFISTPQKSNLPTVWPLVLSILFLVISALSAIFSLSIILSGFGFILGLISLPVSIVALVGARKNEKGNGRDGVLTGARVISIISIILSSIAITLYIIIFAFSSLLSSYFSRNNSKILSNYYSYSSYYSEWETQEFKALSPLE